MNYQEPIKKQWADTWCREYILETCEKEISEINKKIEDAARKGLREIEYKHYISKVPIYSLIDLYIENGFKIDCIEGNLGFRIWGKDYVILVFHW